MVRRCKKCKKHMKQQTRGFNMTFTCECGEILGPISITSVGISKGRVHIIKAGRGTGRSMLT